MIKTDQAARVDILDRGSLAEYITTSIAHTAKQETNGFVVGITGKWGSGKSTLLGFVREKLKASFTNEEACFLEFNPWALSEATDLRKDFLKQFIFGVAPKKRRWYFIRKLMVKIGELFKTITFPSPKLNGLELDLNTLLVKYLDADNSTFYKNQIDKYLEISNRKIFVFIDDIDRLAPGQVFAIFQLLKLTGNFKNTYYVLAFDREAVEISIESQFRNYGQKFLDKIIQADFGMPEISDEKVEQLFFDQLEALVKQLNIPFNRAELSGLWLHRGLKNYFRTIRDINRFFSSLQFSLPPIKEEIHLCDFLVLETLRLNNYPIYEHIFNEGGWSVKSYSGMQNYSFLSTAEERMTKPLLDFLFDTYTRDSKNGKRLRDPHFFDRYFTLRIGQKDVSEKELQMLFENPNTDKILTDTLTFGRMKNLLVRLNDGEILKYYSNWDIVLIEKIFTFFDSRYNDLSLYENAFADAIINLLSVREKDQYSNFRNFLKLLVQLHNRYSGPKVHFLHFMCRDKNENTGFSANSPAFKSYYIQHHSYLEKEYAEYITKWKEYITSRELTNPDSPSTFYFMYDYAYYFEDDYRNRVTDFLKQDSYLLFYLRRLLVFNASDGKPFKVIEAYINRFLPGSLLNDFAHALGRIEPKKLSAEQIEWREFFFPYAFEYLKKNGLLTPAPPNI
ncbi:MAG: KAP family P-loop NTPase fold protein [Sediminibacterium sp.]